MIVKTETNKHAVSLTEVIASETCLTSPQCYMQNVYLLHLLLHISITYINRCQFNKFLLCVKWDF